MISMLAACGGPLSDGDSADGTDGYSEGEETGDHEGSESDEGHESDDSFGSDEGADTGDNLCEVDDFSLAAVTPNVMLVLDKSSSMKNHWDNDGDDMTADVTRWSSLHSVVSTITTEHGDSLNFGLTLFPAIGAEPNHDDFQASCAVAELPDVDVGPNTASAIIDAIPSAEDVNFGGFTPATEGILTGAAHLEELSDRGPTAMILITDGAANCVEPDNFVKLYDDGLPLAISDAWEGAGIPTYVVGIDIRDEAAGVDVNPREALDEVALAGGVARDAEVAFYDTSDPTELEQALEDITHQLDCQVELSFGPQAHLEFSVEVDGQRLEQFDSCADTDGPGWVQIDPIVNPTRIELCNSACVDAEGSGGQATMCPIIP